MGCVKPDGEKQDLDVLETQAEDEDISFTTLCLEHGTKMTRHKVLVDLVLLVLVDLVDLVVVLVFLCFSELPHI